MNKKPIIIVSGEPYSVFLEIFFKTKKKNNFKNPIILISSKELLIKQMKCLKFNFKINIIDENNLDFKKLSKTKINLINIDFEHKKIFDKISTKSNVFIEKSFLFRLYGSTFDSDSIILLISVS